MKIDQKTLRKFSSLISNRCGIKLEGNRQQMLQNRISGRVKQLGLTCYRDYLVIANDDRSDGELDALVDAVTTNYTLFFRDPTQFKHMHDRVAELLVQRETETGKKRRIRIWSTACSTGEEAYTLAITAKEAADSVGHSSDDIRILATDIASSVLKTASKARYSESSIATIPASKKKYFEPVNETSESGKKELVVTDDVRKMVIFRKMNLCDPMFRVPGDIDIIFCRNVLLYFDSAMQRKILHKCSKTLRPGGWLYVGACESVRNMISGIDPIGPSIFQRPLTPEPHDHGSEFFPQIPEVR